MSERELDVLKDMLLSEFHKLRQELRVASKPLLSIDETATYIGLSPKTLRNQLGPRAIKPFPVLPVRIGGRVLFRRSDLDEFIDRL